MLEVEEKQISRSKRKSMLRSLEHLLCSLSYLQLRNIYIQHTSSLKLLNYYSIYSPRHLEPNVSFSHSSLTKTKSLSTPSLPDQSFQFLMSTKPKRGMPRIQLSNVRVRELQPYQQMLSIPIKVVCVSTNLSNMCVRGL